MTFGCLKARQYFLLAYPSCKLALGGSYYRAGKFDKAIAPLERSIALGHDAYEPHLLPCACPRNLWARKKSQFRTTASLRIPCSQRAGVVRFWTRPRQPASMGSRSRLLTAGPRPTIPTISSCLKLLGEALQEKGDLPGAMAAWRKLLNSSPLTSMQP